MFESKTSQAILYTDVKATYEEQCKESEHPYAYFNRIEKLLLQEGCHTPVPII